MILTIIHRSLGYFLVLSAYLLKSRKYLNWAYTIIIAIMVSWLLFKRCILWDLQVRYEKNFNIEKDCICTTYTKNHGDDKRYLCRCLINTLVYLNLIVIGYKLNRLQYTLMFLMFYILINGYPNITDDNLSKYKLRT